MKALVSWYYVTNERDARNDVDETEVLDFVEELKAA